MKEAKMYITKYGYLFLIGITLTIFSACKEDTKSSSSSLSGTDTIQRNENTKIRSEAKIANVKFDLKGFFEKEIGRLKYQNPIVNKSVLGKGKTESKKMQIEDWNKELAVFLESDINKPAWKNSYTVDTIISAGSILIIYRAIEDALTIRQVSVKLNTQNDQVMELSVQHYTKNNLYTSSRILNYKPGVSYTVVGEEKVKMINKSEYLIKVDF